MIETDEQRRWWFATHPQYSGRDGGTGGKPKKKESENKIDPKEVDKYVEEALQHLTDKSVIALLKSVQRNFGTKADTNKPQEPVATIGPPPPPGFSDRARDVLDVLCPGLTKAYDRWRTGYYKAHPWAPGPLYDALGDLAILVPLGLTRIQTALAKAANAAEIAALQTARQELLRIWNWPNFPRGWAFEDLFGRNLPRTFKGVDDFEKGVVTSVKTMHLGRPSYQDPAKVFSKGREYVDKLVNFKGARMKDYHIKAERISERVLRLGVPPGATEAQKSALKNVIEYGKQNSVKVEVIRVP